MLVLCVCRIKPYTFLTSSVESINYTGEIILHSTIPFIVKCSDKLDTEKTYNVFMSVI